MAYRALIWLAWALLMVATQLVRFAYRAGDLHRDRPGGRRLSRVLPAAVLFAVAPVLVGIALAHDS